jgi:hypothetical protein
MIAYRNRWYIALHFVYATVAVIVGLFVTAAGVTVSRQLFGVLVLALGVFLYAHAWLTGSIVARPWGVSLWAGLSRRRLAWRDVARFRVEVNLNPYWSSKQRVIVVRLRHGDDVTVSGFYSFPFADFGGSADRPTFVDTTAAALNDLLAQHTEAG